MSDSDGGKQFAPGRLATILSVAFLIVTVLPGGWWLTSVSARRQAIDQVAACQPAKGGACADKGDIEDARSANADQDAVDVAIIQAILGLAGFIGLVFTVLYARGAWLAAEKTAKSADDTLKEGRVGQERQLRAYVLVDEARAAGMNGEAPLAIGVKFKNFGVTPALKLRMTYYANVHPQGHTPDIKPQRFPDTSEDAVPPNSDRTFSLKLTAQGSDVLAKLKAGTHRLYMWGIFEYEDIFGHAHTTTFFSYATHSKRDADGWYSVVSCPTGNHAT